MDSDQQANQIPVWYVGLHDSKRMLPITEELLRSAQSANYDMLTTPITTPQFQSSVQALLSSYYSELLDQKRQSHEIAPPLIPALRPMDSPLTPHESISQLLGVTSPWIDLASSDSIIANVSRQVFNLEVQYAAFCGIQHIVVPGPCLPDGTICTSGIPQFARTIQEALQTGPYLQVQVLLPMLPSKLSAKSVEDSWHLSSFALKSSSSALDDVNTQDQWGTWEAWNLIRSFCNYNSRLGLALSIPKQLPSPAVQSRWFSEPLKLLILPEGTFIPNKYSQPVLTKGHQAVLSRYMRLRTAPWILLSDVGPIPISTIPESAPLSSPHDPTPQEASASPSRNVSRSISQDPTPHLSYVRALQRKQPPKQAIERFGAGYQDYLQMPLQPLADNLESITYEVFEKDPIKYEWYERAISHALLDWREEEKKPSSPTGAVVIAVVGAGRGPLVTRALHAAEIAGVNVEVWAVEKNPNAYVLLQRRNVEAWNHRVNVVKTDMRAWKGPLLPNGTYGHVDIIVSELLGSFADNELSPECLDGVQHVLNPEHGISIPSSYTAFLTPIATPKLYSDVGSKFSTEEGPFELPYVVMLHAYDYLSYEPKAASSTESHALESPPLLSDPTAMTKTPNVLPCWTFDHPLPSPILTQSSLRRGGSAFGGGGGPTGGDGANAHNTRFAQLNFKCPRRGVCHGLAGYFETVLYPGSDEESRVELSTNPLTMDRMSRDMISWFPIFFPVKTPISFPDNSELQVSIWRQTDDRKVWYEWIVESFTSVQGKQVRLGVSDLHSSKKNGCLM